MNLTFARGTVSVVMCPADGQQKDDKSGQTGTRQEGGIDSEQETSSRPQQDGSFSLKLFRLVFWVDSM